MSNNIESPVSNKTSSPNSIPKPDLSSMIEKDSTFFLKKHGSYKKPKRVYPESPMKSPVLKYFTPIKIEGKNLFGTEPTNTFRKMSYDVMENPVIKSFRKLSFLDNVEEKEEEVQPSPKQGTIIEIKNEANFVYEIKEESNNSNQYKIDSDFEVIKTISKNKLNTIYKCKMIKTGKIYAIKQSYKTSYKNDLSTVKKIFIDLNKKSSYQASNFCLHYLDYWEEEEVIDIADTSNHFTDKNLYILMNYYDNGDLLDYLSKLEQHNFSFNTDFYWDILFEMLAGLSFFHQCGYLHLNVKPSNFLVDDNGYVKLSDFGLSQRKVDLVNIDDIFEGDSAYISPELFNRKTPSEIDEKSDVYSLGLSFLEILAKIDLPKNGKLWRTMRAYEMFSIPKEFLINWNIQEKGKFIELIKVMTAPYKERMNLEDIINSEEFPEIKKRYKMLMQNKYEKTTKVPSFVNKGLNVLNNVISEDKDIIKSPRKV